MSLTSFRQCNELRFQIGTPPLRCSPSFLFRPLSPLFNFRSITTISKPGWNIRRKKFILILFLTADIREMGYPPRKRKIRFIRFYLSSKHGFMLSMIVIH